MAVMFPAKYMAVAQQIPIFKCVKSGRNCWIKLITSKVLGAMAVVQIPALEAQEDLEEALEVDMVQLNLKHSHSLKDGSLNTSNNKDNGEEEAPAEVVLAEAAPNTMAITNNEYSSKFELL
jgi:hypothetical protein